MRIVFFVVGLTITLTAAGRADQKAIRDARTAQNAAIASSDLDRVATFWTEDVTVRRALGQALSGREAARKALEHQAAPTTHLIYQRLTKDVEISQRWPLAFETGTWEGHLGTLAGAVVLGGRYSAQWVKRSDRWLIRSEVFVALTCSGVGCDAVAAP
jgi:ketosteroid isomerase-like protein